MKNEMPASTTIAPIPIATALPPLRPVSLDDPPLVPDTGGVPGGAGTLGVVCGCWGTPGANGLVGVAAPAEAAKPSVAATSATTTAAQGLSERLLHCWCLWSIAIRLLLLDVLLVVHALGIDSPDVVMGAEQDVVYGSHGREHRVV